jgi:hypothetical protein
MSVQSLEAPSLLIFAEAARLLQRAGRSMAESGNLAVAVPLAVSDAIAQAEARLEELDLPRSPQLRQTVNFILKLSTTEDLLLLVQSMVDAAGDLESFLQRAGDEQGVMLVPRQLLYVELLRQLHQTLSPDRQEDLMEGGVAAIAAELERLDRETASLAKTFKTDLTPIQLAARHQLEGQSPEELMQLLETLIAESEAAAALEQELLPDLTEEPNGTVAGPLLFTEIASALLDCRDIQLTPEQHLDLQTNLVKAQSKLEAMDRIGKLDRPDEQLEQIREFVAARSPAELLEVLDIWFAPAELN